MIIYNGWCNLEKLVSDYFNEKSNNFTKIGLLTRVNTNMPITRSMIAAMSLINW